MAREVMASWPPDLVWLPPPPEPAGTSPEQLVAMSRGLASMRQNVDKLAAEITKLQAIQQGAVDRTSASPPLPAVAPGPKPVSQPPPVLAPPAPCLSVAPRPGLSSPPASARDTHHTPPPALSHLPPPSHL